MTTMKLRQSVLQDVVSLLDNDEAMKELQKCVCRLKKKIEKSANPPCQYTVEEVKQRLQESEKRYQQGEYVSHEEAMKQMEQWL